MDLGNLTSKEIGEIMSKGLLREVQDGNVEAINAVTEDQE